MPVSAIRRNGSPRRARLMSLAPILAWLSHQDRRLWRTPSSVSFIKRTIYSIFKLPPLSVRSWREGGYSERLAAVRLAEREKTRAEQVPAADIHCRSPDCPSCGKPMVLRTARKGNSPGLAVLVCAGYPACKGTQPAAETNDRAD